MADNCLPFDEVGGDYVTAFDNDDVDTNDDLRRVQIIKIRTRYSKIHISLNRAKVCFASATFAPLQSHNQTLLPNVCNAPVTITLESRCEKKLINLSLSG